ncbi:MAG: DUF4349 domain-containing protein [Bacteroidota bacterium]
MKKILIVVLLPLFIFSCGSSKRAGGESLPNNLTGSFEKAEQVTSDPTDPVQQDRLMVYEAWQTIKVKDKRNIVNEISTIVKNNSGYVLETSVDRIRFRMPADSLENILKITGQFGEVISQDIHGQDVTEEHMDLNLRLENAKKSRERYLQLLERAENIGDILLIEKELERLQLKIERLQGHLNKLNEIVAYSTITINIQEKIKPGPISWIFVGLYEGVKYLFVWN